MTETMDVAPCCEHVPTGDLHSAIKDNSECCDTVITGGVTLDKITVENSSKIERLCATALLRIAYPDDIPDRRESALKFAYAHQIYPKIPAKLHILNEAYLI